MITLNRPARSNTPLNADQLRHMAPSIFADRPYHSMSERYKFVPTIEVVQMLADQGYRPMSALQSRSRIEGKSHFTKHLIRFRHDDFLANIKDNNFLNDTSNLQIGAEFPELVLTNSHDGTSAYKFMAGIFRLVCLNGLIVKAEDAGSVSLKHSGGSDFHQRVIDVTYEVMDQAPGTLNKIKTWKQIETTQPEREAFAAAAATLRDNDTLPANRLLDRRRVDDRKEDTWTTMNVVQENMIRGGLRGYNPTTHRRTTTREVKSVGENLRLNQAIWQLTEAFAQLKGA